MNIKILCSIFFFLLLGACEKDFDFHDPDVNQFVSMIKDGSYVKKVGYEIPDFRMKDINELLLYAKDTSVVEVFPIHPVASHFHGAFILNECLFWTIDGIRYKNKYPSMGPNLSDTSMLPDFGVGYPRLSGEVLLEISELYLDWYNDYKTNPTEEQRTKNIFENTTYRW